MRRVYKNLQDHLRTLCEDHAAGYKTVSEFLRGTGYNIQCRPRSNDVNEHQEEAQRG